MNQLKASQITGRKVMTAIYFTTLIYDSSGVYESTS